MYRLSQYPLFVLVPFGERALHVTGHPECMQVRERERERERARASERERERARERKHKYKSKYTNEHTKTNRQASKQASKHACMQMLAENIRNLDASVCGCAS